MSSKLWLWGFKQPIWELIYCPAIAGKELLPLRESGKPGWRYLEVLDKRMLCTVGLTPEKSELLLLVLPALAELWQYFSSMDCTFSMHVCPSFSGQCLSSAEQMPRNTCMSGGRLAVLMFRGICRTRASEQSLWAARLCSITGREETSATDWKLKEWSRLLIKGFTVTKIWNQCFLILI